MNGPLRVGVVLYGFCGGYFGRDSYADKRVEAIGADWVIVRNLDDNRPEFAELAPETLTQYQTEEPNGGS